MLNPCETRYGKGAKRGMASPRSLAKFDADMSPRKREILEVAAQLFAERGYRGTSIRDIGKKSGVLGGSLYHHIKSKDVLFVELHNAALDMAADRIDAAIAGASDPWDRLERACVTLVETQLDVNSLTFPMMNDFREVPEEVRQQLIARRDAFEDVFRRLVEDLPLPADVDRSVYRNLLLSQLNSVPHWFRAGRLTPTDIGRQTARIFRHD